MMMPNRNLWKSNYMVYRLAGESDIEEICSLIKNAVANMERDNIFQWDNLYPTKEDFLSDMEKQQLFVGLLDEDISVLYVINKECDRAYESGEWKYPDCEYRVIHRLCVNPNYQNRGIAKNTLLHIERELKKQGVKAIRLDVFSGNPYALSLYVNNGYEKVGYAEWRKGGFFLMEKCL